MPGKARGRASSDFRFVAGECKACLHCSQSFIPLRRNYMAARMLPLASGDWAWVKVELWQPEYAATMFCRLACDGAYLRSALDSMRVSRPAHRMWAETDAPQLRKNGKVFVAKGDA